MRNFFKFTFILFISLTAKAQFTASIVSSSPPYCTDLPVYLTVNPGSAAFSYTWSVLPAKASFNPSANSASPSIVFTAQANYTVTVLVSNGTATTSASRIIGVSKRAVAAFNASLATAGFPNQLQLTNYSSNQVKSYWMFNDTPSIDSSLNVVKDYNASGNYTVNLIALGRNGCNDTLEYSFRISDSSSVVLPNVFTPNYDGVNDVFKPLTRGISDLSVWIYNRDGVLITTWNKVNGHWDGHTTSGLECSAGQYFVILDATGFDKKTYKLKSNLTLLR